MSQFGTSATTAGGPKTHWSGRDFFDQTQWKFLLRDSDQSNNELAYFTPDNCTLSSGGIFQITPKLQSLNGRAYTAGMVQAVRQIHGGTLSIRCKTSPARGAWTIFWLLGAGCQLSNLTTPDNVGTCNWPSQGSREIDIVEILQSATAQCNCQIHSDQGNPGGLVGISDSATAFHVYDCVWVPGVSCIWKQDGTTIQSVTSSVVPDEPMFPIISLTIGGAGGTVVDADLSDPTVCSYFIDYVNYSPL